jgi:methylglutaconyl-CoA hydratase
MGDGQKVKIERDGWVARIWLERPDVHNAFDAELIAQLSAAIDEASADEGVRAIVLGGRGRSFSAGADLAWMKSARTATAEENEAGSRQLAQMLRALERTDKVTIARVQGTALGGGLGLIAACDLAIAVARAKFGFSEVNLGLIPAVISPHVIAKIGVGRARHLFVTGERFDAATAERYGLVTHVVDDEAALDVALAEVLEQIKTSAPGAVAAAKELIRNVTRLPAAEVDAYTAPQIARQRVSAEAQEGIGAFLEKRKAKWSE